MAYNYVTVSGSFPSAGGTVTFSPPEVTDLTGTIPVLGPGVLSYALSGGSFTTAPLLATDNIGLLPPAWNWQVTVALTGQRAYTYPVLVPSTAGTATTLSSLAVSAAGGGAGEGFGNPMTALGDTISGGGSGVPARLAGSTSATRNFITQTGTGSTSAPPAWGTIASADLPAGTTSARGALQLDGTASDIVPPVPGTPIAGATGKAADAGHAHALNDPLHLGYTATFDMNTAISAAAVPANNDGVFMRFKAGGYTISNLIVFVSNSSGNISVATYTGAGSGPNAVPTGGQTATSGTLACPANGNATVSLGGTVTPALTDWAGLSSDTTAATFYMSGGINTNLVSGLGGFQGAAHPLPPTPSISPGVQRFVSMRGV